MKLTKLLFSLANLNGAVIPSINLNTNVKNKHRNDFVRMENKTIDIETNTDVVNRNFSRRDLYYRNNEAELSSDQPTQLILSKEQSDFISNTKVKNLNITLDYNLEFITPLVKNSVNVSHSFNYAMGLSKDSVEKEVSILNEKNKEIKFKFSSKDNEIFYRNKDNKTILQVRPFILMNLIEFENNKLSEKLGYYHIKLVGIRLSGDCQIYNLNKIMTNPISLEYKANQNDTFVNSWFKTEELNELVNKKYGLPIDFIDMEKTRKNLKTDILNNQKQNKIFVTLFVNNKYLSEGVMVQEINFNRTNSNLNDLENLKQIYSSELYENIKGNFLQPLIYDVEIDLDRELIVIDNGVNEKIRMGFINDGQLKNYSEYRSLKIIKDNELVAFMKNGLWRELDVMKTDGLINLLDNNIKESENALDNHQSEEETKAANDTKDDFLEEENNIESVKNNESKTNVLNYLWLLLIPFVLGAITLLIRFGPFWKRKKR